MNIILQGKYNRFIIFKISNSSLKCKNLFEMNSYVYVKQLSMKINISANRIFNSIGLKHISNCITRNYF